MPYMCMLSYLLHKYHAPVHISDTARMLDAISDIIKVSL